MMYTGSMTWQRKTTAKHWSMLKDITGRTGLRKGMTWTSGWHTDISRQLEVTEVRLESLI